MTFKEEIELQIKDNKMLSYEILNQLKDKYYGSGRSKQVGDTVLFGFIEEKNDVDDVNLRLITFHEEELGVLYEENSDYYKGPKQTKLPYIKLKENGNKEE